MDNMKTILLNLTKMLTERKFLDNKKFDENYKKILKQNTNERIFKIKSDFSSDEYHIMVIYGKISSIKKIEGLDAFITDSENKNKIFIGNNISQKAFKQFVDIPKSEVFFEYELMMNIIEHELQPKFELLTEEEKNIKLKEYNLNISNLQTILKTDPVARYYNAKPGDVFRIIRPSPYTGTGFSYRRVAESSVTNIFA